MVVISRTIASAVDPLYTLFLFTKSDVKTTVIPITLFAVAAAPLSDWAHLGHLVLWIWLHLLQFDISNQTLSPEEDTMNKRDRPLPSGRISMCNALILRWSLVPLCCGLSALYSRAVFWTSVFIALTTILYNEGAVHGGQWLIRNVLLATGYSAFELGATLVAAKVPHLHALDRTGVLAVCLSAGIYVTTQQAQDFKDVHGDRAVGRRTLPIILPSIARYAMTVPMLVWSVCLVTVWKLDPVTQVAFLLLSVFAGARFLTHTTTHDDRVSFWWYSIWFSIAHILPGYHRVCVQA